MKEVTEGVRDVELEDGKPVPASLAAPEEKVAQSTEEDAGAEAAAVPLPESPTLKAAEGEDQDAEGEIDVEAKEGEVVAPVEDATLATAQDALEVAPIAAAPADSEEVPGLTLSASPSKPTEETTADS